MKKLIIFDWDDTFTSGVIEGYYQCYHSALKGVGVDMPRSEEERIIRSFWGRPHREVVAALLKGEGEFLERVVELYNEHLMDGTFLDCLSVIPGSLEVLSELSSHYVLTVASAGNPVVLKEKVFPHFNVPAVFAQVLTSRELKDPSRGKPYPDLAQEIMASQGFDPDQAIVVGDGASDVKMAHAAGIEVAAVLTGQLTKEEAVSLGAEHILKDVTELPELLNGL